MGKNIKINNNDSFLVYPFTTSAVSGFLIGLIGSTLFLFAIISKTYFYHMFTWLFPAPNTQQNLFVWTLLGSGLLTCGLIEIILQFDMSIDNILSSCAILGLSKWGLAIIIIIAELFGKNSKKRMLKILLFGFSFILTMSIMSIFFTYSLMPDKNIFIYSYNLVALPFFIFISSIIFAKAEEGRGNFGALCLTSGFLFLLVSPLFIIFLIWAIYRLKLKFTHNKVLV